MTDTQRKDLKGLVELPTELLFNIYLDLGKRDLLRLCYIAITNKAERYDILRILCNSSMFWKTRYKQDFPGMAKIKDSYRESWIYLVKCFRFSMDVKLAIGTGKVYTSSGQEVGYHSDVYYSYEYIDHVDYTLSDEQMAVLGYLFKRVFEQEKEEEFSYYESFDEIFYHIMPNRIVIYLHVSKWNGKNREDKVSQKIREDFPSSFADSMGYAVLSEPLLASKDGEVGVVSTGTMEYVLDA